MKTTIEVRFRKYGCSDRWADIPASYTTELAVEDKDDIPRATVEHLVDLHRDLRTSNVLVKEFRWNTLGSLQGHYYSPDAKAVQMFQVRVDGDFVGRPMVKSSAMKVLADLIELSEKDVLLAETIDTTEVL